MKIEDSDISTYLKGWTCGVAVGGRSGRRPLCSPYLALDHAAPSNVAMTRDLLLVQ